MPKVSVIIPAYNAAQTIGATLDSICTQTGPSFEIVVVDDGSADNTADVVRRHAPSATIVQQANAGRGAARNAGFARSQGEYVYFFDSDDIMEPDAISRLSDWLDAHPACDVAYGDTLVFCGDPQTATVREPRCSESGTLLFRHLSNPFILPIASMLRRAAYDRVGGMNTQLKSNEDWHFWLKLSACGAVFEPIGGPPVARYRTYEQSRASSLVHPWSAVEALQLLKAEYGEEFGRRVDIDYRIAQARASYARTLLREGQTVNAWREWLRSLIHCRQHFTTNSFVFLTSLVVPATTTERLLIRLSRIKRSCLSRAS